MEDGTVWCMAGLHATDWVVGIEGRRWKDDANVLHDLIGERRTKDGLMCGLCETER